MCYILRKQNDNFEIAKQYVSYCTTSITVAKRGIGSALVSEALRVASKNGIKAIQCMALSLYTQKLCQRFNFEEISRYRFISLQNIYCTK